MRILHTADIHLGKNIYDKSRFLEHEKFLNFLHDTLVKEEIDVLLICGDVFDTQTPSHKSQELYYKFLSSLPSVESLKDVVITGGNHDSPSFLNACRPILKSLNVHVVSAFNGDLNEEVLVLKDKNDKPYLVIGAVPYLRQKDVRLSDFYDDGQDKALKLKNGIANHYKEIGLLCEKAAKEFSPPLPIIGCGHLFVTGASVSSDEKPQSLYVGTLDNVPVNIFPDCFLYTALGHLHSQQTINNPFNKNIVRYSGSPLQLSFSENCPKSLSLIEISNTKEICVSKIEVPIFCKLVSLKGKRDEIIDKVNELVQKNKPLYLEVLYEDSIPIADLADVLYKATEDSLVELLAIKDLNLKERFLKGHSVDEYLEDLTPKDVLERCLISHNIPEDLRSEYHKTFDEIIGIYNEQDKMALKDHQ